MEKYITRDKLADFVEKMWDSGIRCDLKPNKHEISLWNDDLDKVDYVTVVEMSQYDNVVNEVRNKFLPKIDSAHTINAAE